MRSLNQYILEYLPISKLDKSIDPSEEFINLLNNLLNHGGKGEYIKPILDFMYDNDDIFLTDFQPNINKGYVSAIINEREYRYDYLIFFINGISYTICEINKPMFSAAQDLNSWINVMNTHTRHAYELPDDITIEVKKTLKKWDRK